MSALRVAAAALTVTLLSGCLEVRQHPAWIDGAYDGKHDNRVAQVKYHNDKMAWFAAISNRMMNQNEYNRANP